MRASLALLFALSSLGFCALPPEAADLKLKRDAKINEINAAYLAALQKVQKKEMAANNLDAANDIQNEIDSLLRPDQPKDPASPGKLDADPMKALIGKWKRDSDSALIEFTNESSGVYSNTPFTMSFDAKTKMITLTSEKWTETLSFTLDRDILKGGHNKKQPFKLIRVK